jgi:hypothetical protein
MHIRGFRIIKLLPSLEAYQQIQSGAEIPDKYNQTIF